MSFQAGFAALGTRYCGHSLATKPSMHRVRASCRLFGAAFLIPQRRPWSIVLDRLVPTPIQQLVRVCVENTQYRTVRYLGTHRNAGNPSVCRPYFSLSEPSITPTSAFLSTCPPKTDRAFDVTKLVQVDFLAFLGDLYEIFSIHLVGHLPDRLHCSSPVGASKCFEVFSRECSRHFRRAARLWVFPLADHTEYARS